MSWKNLRESAKNGHVSFPSGKQMSLIDLDMLALRLRNSATQAKGFLDKDVAEEAMKALKPRRRSK